MLFGLSDDEFWNLAPEEWIALVHARANSLKVYDAFQARISYMIAATSMSKTKHKENDFRFFPEPIRGKNLLNKWLGIVSMFKARKEISNALSDK